MGQVNLQFTQKKNDEKIFTIYNLVLRTLVL